MTLFERQHAPILTALILGLALAATGCGDDGGDDGGDTGTAPAISNLTYTMDPLTVGETATVSGRIDFTDDDADAEQLNISITLPDGQTQALPPIEAQGVSGINAGSVDFLLALNPPVAGEYTFAVSMSDAEGNTSNALDGALTAQ